MSGFPLLDLNPLNLEKVIRKLEKASYCSLQQTCKDVNKFIGSNRKISVFFDGRYQMDQFYGVLGVSYNSLPAQFYCYIIRTWGPHQEQKTISLKALYGARLEHLWIPSKIPVDPFCDMVKNHRITCHFLTIWKTPMEKKELTALLGCVKPRQINVHCYKSTDCFEALWESKTLKKVHVCVDPSVVVRAVPKFLERLEDVKLRAICETEQYALLQAVLQILLSQLWPNLRRFEFSAGWSLPRYPTTEELGQLFPGIRLTRDESPNDRRVYLLEELPEYVPQNAACQLTLANSAQGGCRIRYTRWIPPA